MKWEYAVKRLNSVSDKIDTALAEAGPDGWELVAVFQQPPHLTLIFKRPAQ